MDSAKVVGFVSPASNQAVPPKRFPFAADVTPAPSVKFEGDRFGSLAKLGSVVSVPRFPKVFQLRSTASGATLSSARIAGAVVPCGGTPAIGAAVEEALSLVGAKNPKLQPGAQLAAAVVAATASATKAIRTKRDLLLMLGITAILRR